MTKKEHSQWITDEYKGWFVNPKRMVRVKTIEARKISDIPK